MSQSNYLAVVPPPPTFDPATYKPFDDEYERTIEKILSEDASFECKDDHFPEYSGSRSLTGTSNPHTPQSESQAENSRILSRSQSTGRNKLITTPRRAAQRDITVIHLDTDDEGDVDIDSLLEVESAKFASKEDHSQSNTIGLSYRDMTDPHDPMFSSEDVGSMLNREDVRISGQGDNQERKQVDDHHEYPDSLDDSIPIDNEASRQDADYNFTDSHPRSFSHGDGNMLKEFNFSDEEKRLGRNENKVTGDSDITDDENNTNKDSNDDIHNSEALHADVHIVADAKSNSGGIPQIPTNSEIYDLVADQELAAEKIRAEEDVIFACMEPSRRQEFFQSVLAHPFMQNLEVPVRQSARRQFVKDMRREAASVGMNATDIDTFIVYMRRVFMESIIGVPADTTGDVRNLRFGEEINDGYKSRKRNLSNSEQAGSFSSLQATPQRTPEVNNATQPHVEQTVQSISQRNGCGSLCKDKNVTLVPKTPEYISCEQYPAQGFGTVQKGSQQDMQISNHLNEAENLGAKQANTQDAQPADDLATVGEVINGNDLPYERHIELAPPRVSLGSQHDSQPPKPELPPIVERATRPQKLQRNQGPSYYSNEWIGSGSTLEQSVFDHTVIDMTLSSHSPEPAIPSELPEETIPAMTNPEKSSHNQDHQAMSLHNDNEKAADQSSKTHGVKPGPKTELSLPGKKAKNYRKKEKKRQKKRESYLHIQNASNADQQRAERQHTPVHSESTAVAATPPSRTSNRSTDMMRHGPLSPNPAECDEVLSKYFPVVSAPKRHETSATATRHIPIPEETRQILAWTGLDLDFISSDSTLSDVLSDIDCDDELLLHSTNDASTESTRFLSPPITLPPSTPVKQSFSLRPETPRLSRPKLPTVSPYFPSLSGDPESCLPFPPIDAPSFGLIQEQLAHDPFKLIIATIFLNRTRGGVALPILFRVFARYPTIDAMAIANPSELVSMIHCLGFQNQRARKCISIAQIWQVSPPVKNKRYRKLHYPRKLDGRDVGPLECADDEDHRVAWEIAHLPGVGAYSLDSWRIFCRDALRGLATDWKGTGATTDGFVPEWKSVLPQDKELRAYLAWMWLKEGWIWDHHTGDLTPASEKMMRAAQKGGVAHQEDGNWILECSPGRKATNGFQVS
ncbi:Pre-mRNA splicing factor [Penicillium maclennaniae]|uniref:Pre-mRNA splicing factor n=1 Tax=Penicillium maclennaniae TaxID=1343394 RepID=UPI0025408DC6|nr:Pre-mRNA splicing factor [Penicillium maclennaniae]KAJ5677226.1 Pre-mRNA splicing factor [Penicillium maclennaniae]